MVIGKEHYPGRAMGGFIRKAVESYIRGEDDGKAGALLRPLTGLYGAGVRARLGLYSAGFLKTKALPCTVISVGNITAGGTGKTPVTMHIARYLKDKGMAVVILSRGYGGSLKGIGVVSDGNEVLLGPVEAGDEPVLMARNLGDIPVVVGPDRFSAGELAIKKFSPDIIILDDGFQHIRLSRDLNILLIDGAVELNNARLLPAGPLREPLTGLQRADMVLVKGGRLQERDRALMRKYNIAENGFVFKAGGVTELAGGEARPVKSLKGKPILAIAAIARPDSFFSLLKDLGMNVAGTMAYTDHHGYNAGDIAAIRLKMKATGAEAIITTEKDGVKLAPLLQGADIACYTLAITVEMKNKSAFRQAMRPFIRGAKPKGTRP